MRGIFLRGLALYACLLGNVHADAGLSWLSSQSQGDGSIATISDISTPFQSTAETLRTFSLYGVTSGSYVTAAQQYLGSQTYLNTENLSRLIVAGATAGQDVSGAVSALLLNQDGASGGFGELPGYQPSVLDTAFALEALGVSGISNSAVISKALGFLQHQQNSDGSWQDGDNNPSVYLSALSMHAAWLFRNSFSVNNTTSKASNYLLAQRDGNGNWPEIHQSALSLIAILPTLVDQSSVSNSIAALQSAQQSNGSWNNAVYTTALVLRALNSSTTANPDLATITATVVDGQTGQALSGVSATLSGPTSGSMTTTGNGQVTFTHLSTTGQYQLQLSLSGYNTVTTVTTAKTGGTISLGTIQLLKPAGTTSGGTGGTGPTTGTIEGKVTDTANNQGLAGVTVSTSGGLSATTNFDGGYQMSNVPPGSISVMVSKSGYSTATGTGTVTAGGVLAFSPGLTVQAQPDTIIQGFVTDGVSGNPLSGVAITTSGANTVNTTTASDGSYRLAGLNTGTTTITVSLSGYDTVAVSVGLTQNSITNFSPQIYATGTSPANANTASVKGVVLDSATNQPLSGVTVAAVNNVGSHAYWRVYITQGSSADAYIALSEVEFRAIAGGQNQTAGGTAIADSTYPGNWYPSNAYDGNPNTSWNNAGGFPSWIGYHFTAPVKVAEYVLRSYQNSAVDLPVAWTLQYSDDGSAWTNADSRSNQSFGAGDSKAYTPIKQTTLTNANGQFMMNGFTDESENFQFSLVDYVSTQFSYPLQPAVTTDLGQVRLRPLGIDQLLPDLVVKTVDSTTAANTNPQTLQLSGTVNASITNIGTAQAAGGLQVLAFYDVNLDGVYQEGTDTLLGTAQISAAISVNQTQSVQIPVSGTLPFRDAPVSIFVDSAQTVAESNENNNVGASSSSCAVIPDSSAFEPVLKWAWTGSPNQPQYDQVMMAPIVVPLEDTNGDGKIDQKDIPAVVFISFRGQDRNYETDGILRAVSGKDGHEIWSVTDPSLRVAPVSSLAAADLDDDGTMEIIVHRTGQGLMVFEHDGRLRWQFTSPALNTGGRMWGGPAIANLDGVGAPEIIVGNAVINANGSVRWQAPNFGAGTDGVGPLSIVADIDLDGVPEIIDGNSVYAADGHLVWRSTVVANGGFAAVATFDKTKIPQIVVVSNGQVALLDNHGNKIWGPVAIPGGGTGGPPTIADMNGDGMPEIGVAGATAYTVFNSDGSVLWSQPSRDNSALTGSSAFDFSGDGNVEVLYTDEVRLRVFRGTDGTTLFELPNSTATTYEMPIVADVDNDNHADIILASNDFAFGSNHGIRVFQDRQNKWVNTRKIWNQHSYHITNINDDGTVPKVEANSWEKFNTYRLNQQPGQAATGVADLTASLLKILDGGIGQPLTLTARIGNGGQLTSLATTAAFYAGDPSNGGTLIGSVPVAAIEPARYQNIQLAGVTGLSSSQEIYVVADPANTVEECNKTNNAQHIPFKISQQLAAITVSTDASSYASSASAVLSGTITNQGSQSANLKVNLKVLDVSGNVVTDFGIKDLGVVAGGATTQATQTWNTGTTLAGSYVLDGLVLGADNSSLAEATSSFAIRGGDGTGASTPSVSLRVSTDKQTYSTTDSVNLGDLVKNLTVNAPVNNASLQIQVVDPNGAVVYTKTISLRQLSPGAVRQFFNTYALHTAPQGAYAVNGWVLDGSGSVLASGSATFKVLEDLGRTITGTETAQSPWVYQGDPQTCTDVVTNRGSESVTALSIHQAVVNLDTGVLDQEAYVTASLAPGASKTFTRVFSTNGYATGHHACAIEAQANGNYKPLANAVFEVRQPPVRVTGNLSLGDKGRLLVLMDGPSDHSSGGSLCNSGLGDVSFEVDFDKPLSPEAVVEVKVLNGLGLLVDSETTSLRSFTGEVNTKTGNQGIDLVIPSFTSDTIVIALAGTGAGHLLSGTYKLVATVTDPVQNLTFNSGLFSLTCNTVGAIGDTVGKAFRIIGINNNTHTGTGIGDGKDSIGATAQKATLKSLLDLDGWSYDISIQKDDFANKFRGGAYQNYALLSEYQVLDEQIQRELRESIFAGDGLINAGRHDVRRRILDNPLGIEYRGTQLSPTAAQMLTGNVFSLSGQSAFTQNNQIQRFVLEGASVDGKVLTSSHSAQDGLITHYAYGNGRSSLGAFDLLAEASADGNASGLFANLIRKPLIYANPSQAIPVAGRVVPVRLSVTNTGIANTTAVNVSASLGGYIVAANGGTVSSGQLTWNINLAANQTQTIDLWVQLPAGGIPLTVTATLTASAGSFTATPVSVTYNISPITKPSLDQAITDLTDYVNHQPKTGGLLGAILDPILGIKTPAARALELLKAANQDLTSGKVQRALAEQVQATDLLINDGAVALKPIRLEVDESIYQTQKLQ